MLIYCCELEYYTFVYMYIFVKVACTDLKQNDFPLYEFEVDYMPNQSGFVEYCIEFHISVYIHYLVILKYHNTWKQVFQVLFYAL